MNTEEMNDQEIKDLQKIIDLISENKKLQKENEKLKDALAFYACGKHVTHIQMSPNPDDSGGYLCIEKTSGELANKVLNKLREQGDEAKI